MRLEYSAVFNQYNHCNAERKRDRCEVKDCKSRVKRQYLRSKTGFQSSDLDNRTAPLTSNLNTSARNLDLMQHHWIWQLGQALQQFVVLVIIKFLSKTRAKVPVTSRINKINTWSLARKSKTAPYIFPRQKLTNFSKQFQNFRTSRQKDGTKVLEGVLGTIRGWPPMGDNL